MSRKGIPNKVTKLARDIAAEVGVDPLRILLSFASDNWKALGYESPKLLKITADGGHEVDRISAELRMQAAREACKYIYPTQKAVEFTGDQNVFKVVIEDFSKKS